jgi:fumarate hydratase class I
VAGFTRARPAARPAQDRIRKVEALEYPELAIEAVWRIEVENFPAFIVIDARGMIFMWDWNNLRVDITTHS